MIKTYKASNNGNIQTGLVEIQPATNKPDDGQMTSSAGSKKPPKKTSSGIGTQAVNQTLGEITSTENLDATEVADKIGSAGYVMPTYVNPNPVTVIAPGFQISSDPTVSLPRSSDELAVASKKFDSYEHLTGISKERPEIIMMTSFQPLYVPKSASDSAIKTRYTTSTSKELATPAGEFFDQQCAVRTLRDHNTKQMMYMLKKKYDQFQKEISSRYSTFTNGVGQMGVTSYYLWNLMRMLERVKQQLDVRDDVHTIDPAAILKKHVAAYSPIRAEAVLKYLSATISTSFPEKYDMPHALSLFGFSESNTKHVYSSTKIWMQLMYELKQVLKSHSLDLLDIDHSIQTSDDSAVKITKTPGIKRFEYNHILPGDLPYLSQLKDMQPVQVGVITNIITDTYNILYENVQFKNEEMRIAGLINMISKEYRYSRGLSTKEVQDVLSTYYGFSTSVGGNNNDQVFDAIIGKFGNSVTDVSAANTNSLVGLAQQQPDDKTIVLPFESRYIEGNNGSILSPGSAYYVDYALVTDGNTFNTSKLTVLQETLERANKNFNVIVGGLNLLSSEYEDNFSNQSGRFDSILSNSRALFNVIRGSFINDTGMTSTDFQSDPLGPVVAAAHTNVNIRTLLLLFIITKMSRAYITNVPLVNSSQSQDNTPTTNKIIDDIIDELLNHTKNTTTASQTAGALKYKPGKTGLEERPLGSIINVESIRSALNNNSSRLILSMRATLSSITAAFRIDSQAVASGKSLFGGHPDTVILMTVLDVMTSMVYNYGNKHITGKHISSGVTSFTIDERDQNHTESIKQIDSRLRKEIVAAQHAIFAVFNTLEKLSNSIRNCINYINGPESLEQLKKISAILEDTSLLPLLFSEQQIRLFASSVADLTLQLTTNNSGVTGDVDSGSLYDFESDIKTLDDSVLTPKMKEAIEAYMQLPEHSSKSAASKKIMTVGIPLGFSRNLQQKVSESKLKRTSFDVRQNDVIEISIFKVDMQNPDIIYLPQKYLFELSRFPVRHDSLIKDYTAQGLSGIINRFATRDYEQVFSEGGSDVQYYGASSTETEALAGSSYDFLTKAQKTQLYTNHISSYFLETYLKVMTGISTGDYHFNLVDPPPVMGKQFIENVVNHQLNYMAEVKNYGSPETSPVPSGDVFFSLGGSASVMQQFGKVTSSPNSNDGPQTVVVNSSDNSGVSYTAGLGHYTEDNPVTTNAPTKTTDEALSEFSYSQVPGVMHSYGVINEFSRTLSPQGDPLPLTKKMLSPKQFDRVFNIMVDPYEFKINVPATNATFHGKQALEQLIKKGDVQTTTAQASFYQASVNPTQTYSLRKKDGSEGDITFEKYIVSINTVGELEVLCQRHCRQKQFLLLMYLKLPILLHNFVIIFSHPMNK